MRTHLSWWLVVFALISLVVTLGGLSACGGGGGGGGGGGTPPPDSIPTPDAALTHATENVLDSAAAPDAALVNFSAEVVRIYAQSADLDEASDTVDEAWLAALEDGSDFQSLWQSTLNIDTGVSALVSPASFSDGCNAGAAIFSVNGILTTHGEAESGRAKFIEAWRRRNQFVPNTPECAMQLFYNKSGLESFGIQAFCRVFGLVKGFSLPFWQEAHQRTCVSGLGFAADFFESYNQWLLTRQHAPNLSDADVVALRQRIRSALAIGKIVVLVAHSQGNFFVEAAVNGLAASEKRLVGVLAIASPSSYGGESNRDTYGSFRHYTLENDAILDVPGALEVNGSNILSQIATDLSGRIAVHGFVRSYLLFGESRNATMDLFHEIVQELKLNLVTPTIAVNPATIVGGLEPVLLSWSAAGPAVISDDNLAFPDIGSVAASGSKWVQPAQTTTFTITYQSWQASVTLTVTSSGGGEGDSDY